MHRHVVTGEEIGNQLTQFWVILDKDYAVHKGDPGEQPWCWVAAYSGFPLPG